MTIIDRSLKAFARVIATAYGQWESAGRTGLLQGLDPRVKIILLVYIAVGATLRHDIMHQALLLVFLWFLAAASRLPLLALARTVATLAFLFGLVLSLPAAVNIVVPGRVVLPLVDLHAERTWWIYRLPAVIGVTAEGLERSAVLTLRVANSLTAALVVMHTTPFFDLMKALRLFRVPAALIMIIMLSYKYLFIFARTAEDFYRALKSRLAGPLEAREIRAFIAGRLFFIFQRSRRRYEEIYQAMVCRGFTGEIILAPGRALTRRDVIGGAAILAAVTLILAAC